MDFSRKLTHKLSLLQVLVMHRILLSTANQIVNGLRRNPCVVEPRTVQVMATPILFTSSLDTGKLDAAQVLAPTVAIIFMLIHASQPFYSYA